MATGSVTVIDSGGCATAHGHFPFADRPPRSDKTLWLKPQLTVKVQYLEWTTGQTLRQPIIQGMIDIPPEECRIEKNPVKPG